MIVHISSTHNYCNCAFVICYIRYTRSSAKQNQFTDRKQTTTYLKLSSECLSYQSPYVSKFKSFNSYNQHKNPSNNKTPNFIIFSIRCFNTCCLFKCLMSEEESRSDTCGRKHFCFLEVADVYAAFCTSRYKKPTCKSCLYWPHLETYMLTMRKTMPDVFHATVTSL